MIGRRGVTGTGVESDRGRENGVGGSGRDGRREGMMAGLNLPFLEYSHLNFSAYLLLSLLFISKPLFMPSHVFAIGLPLPISAESHCIPVIYYFEVVVPNCIVGNGTGDLTGACEPW